MMRAIPTRAMKAVMTSLLVKGMALNLSPLEVRRRTRALPRMSKTPKAPAMSRWAEMGSASSGW